MASMIDVVFLLLIFFMCTSNFSKLENDLPAQMPQAGQAETKEQVFEPVHVKLSHVNNATVIKCGDDMVGTIPGLVAKLKALRTIDNVPIIIEGSPTVPFGAMVAALDACYQADLRNVAFSSKGVGP